MFQFYFPERFTIVGQHRKHCKQYAELFHYDLLSRSKLILKYLFLTFSLTIIVPILPVITNVFRRETFTGLLTYCIFTSFSYKTRCRTLVGTTYKINNTWLGLNQDIKKLLYILKKNFSHPFIIERVLKRKISRTQGDGYLSSSFPDQDPTFYFKLSYIGSFSSVLQKQLRHLIIRRCCNNFNIKYQFFFL